MAEPCFSSACAQVAGGSPMVRRESRALVAPPDGTKLWGDGFEIETIINTRVAKAGLRIAEVPSYEYPRLHGNSNLNTWRDGGRVVRALLVERFNGKATPRRHHFAGNVVAGAYGWWARGDPSPGLSAGTGARVDGGRR